MAGGAQCGISLGMDECTPCGVSNKGRCKWGWDLSGGECMLRSLNGGRRCDGALPTRTVGDMRWRTWAFGWLRRRKVAWFLAFVDAAVENLAQRSHPNLPSHRLSPSTRQLTVSPPPHQTPPSSPSHTSIKRIRAPHMEDSRRGETLHKIAQRPSTDVPAGKIPFRFALSLPIGHTTE